MSEIQFSIVITSYNQREFIKQAVDSALALRNAGREIIVVDDGSTDGSQEVLKAYGESIRLVCLDTNSGACVALNRGAALATGEYLVFLDGDDAFSPWTLEVYRRIVEARKPRIILACMQWFEGESPATIAGCSPGQLCIVEYPDYLRKDRPFEKSASALVINRMLFQTVQGWPVDLWPMNDTHFILTLCASGRIILVLSPPTIFRRSHLGNTVKNIPPFITSLQKIIQFERSGRYPGGKLRRFQRHALIGGSVIHWTRRAIENGLWREAIKLLVQGWPMALSAVTRNFIVTVKGRRPCEAIQIQMNGTHSVGSPQL